MESRAQYRTRTLLALPLALLSMAGLGCSQPPRSAAASSQAYPPTSPGTDSLEQVRVTGAVGRRLDSLLSGYEAQGFSGTVLVVQRGTIMLSKGYGFANKESRIRNTPATRYELNSLTKMFTAAAILQLAGEGKLRLDDPIEKHLGSFPADKRSATIDHLASHTAGLVVAGTPTDGSSRDAFVASMKATPMESAPGTKYRYTNAGYSMLAAIIEAASGMGYEDYLRQRIFAPAGMRSAVFRNAVPAADTLFARGYGPPDDNGPAAFNPYVWGTIGAGGVWSTMGDVYRWIVAIDKGIVVPAEYSKLLHSPPRPPSREAYGWHVYPKTDSTSYRIEKGGGSNLLATQLLRVPDEGLVIIWASNDLTKRWRQDLNRALPAIALTAR